MFDTPAFYRSVSKCILGVPAIILLLSAPQAQASDVHWARTNGACRGLSFEISLSCGEIGSYLFSSEPISSAAVGCVIEAGGVEDPRRVDKTGTSSPEEPGTRCADGPCLRGGSGSGNSDKIHMIDWSLGSHGAWTSAIFSQAINFQGWWVHLLDISLIGLALDVPEASDLHVLESLCETINFDPPPPVLNMGFGRLLDNDPCATESLVCEVSRALEYLHDEQGVILLASAGNHNELLFPASHEDVIAVGMLDTSKYWPLGAVAASSHTPPEAQALVPGYGLLVFGPTGDDVPFTPPFPAPPGSSNSSALLSGWIAEVNWNHPGVFDFLRDDEPDGMLSIYTGSDGYYLQVGTDVLEESHVSRIDRVLDAAFGLSPLEFEYSTYEATYQLEVAEQPSDIELPSSRPRLLTATNLPTPDSEPCVPCRLRARRRGRLATRTNAATIEVDIEVKSGAMAADGKIDDLMLEVGTDLYAFTGVDYSSMISDLENGVDVILQADLPEQLLEQGSLSFVVLLTRTSDNEKLWDAIPISIHLEPIERLFATTFETADTTPWN